jgi:XrtJ-associated TM-motif-TM protein
MIKFRYVALSMLTLLSTAKALYAQGGCVNSPEAPTALLLLVGSAGMLYGPNLLRKVFRRGGSR